jgi:hypothetical protein
MLPQQRKYSIKEENLQKEVNDINNIIKQG